MHAESKIGRRPETGLFDGYKRMLGSERALLLRIMHEPDPDGSGMRRSRASADDRTSPSAASAQPV